jgi:hypothetical protein
VIVVQHAARERERLREICADERAKGVSIALAGALEQSAVSRRGVG